MGIVYTFYSYKGGVGRTMALANVAALMARLDKRVLIVDWDLEAPGLEAFFERGPAKLEGSRKSKDGIVDLLTARTRGTELDWRSCLLEATVFGRRLSILSAGRKQPSYQSSVQQLNWVELYEKHRIGDYVDQLRREWSDAYDFVLIDSRTGITDIGDICTVILPDALVLLFVSNYQNIRGIKDLMGRASAAHKKLPVNRSRLIGIPVPARDEVYNEYDKALEWKRIYAQELGDLYRIWLPRGVEPLDALDKLFIPYVTNWSFGERLPVVENEREIANPTSISAAYMRLTQLLVSGLDWNQVVVADPEQLALAHTQVREVKAEAEQAKSAAMRSKRGFLAAAAIVVVMSSLFGWSAWQRSRVRSSWEIVRGDVAVEGTAEWVNALQFLHAQGESLAGIQFPEGTKLEGARFAGANLDGADLTDVDLSGADLSGASLIGASLVGASLVGANLAGTNLRKTNLSRANLEGARGLEVSLIRGAVVSESTTPPSKPPPNWWKEIVRKGASQSKD